MTVPHYDREVKILTDQMVAKAVRILAEQHVKFLKDWMVDIEAKYGSLLAADFRYGQRFDAIKGSLERMNAPKSTVGQQSRLDYALDARREMAEIEKALIDLKG